MKKYCKGVLFATYQYNGKSIGLQISKQYPYTYQLIRNRKFILTYYYTPSIPKRLYL